MAPTDGCCAAPRQYETRRASRLDLPVRSADITEAKLADGLTGLPNRVLFLDLLDRAMRRSSRKRDYQFALVILGLNSV
jgi:PleD family two-component response regulator